MGIGVLDMVEMYASSVCDTQTILSKDSVESPSSCRGIKRPASAAWSEDSGLPQSSRSYSSDTFASSSSSSSSSTSTSSPDRDSSKRYTILSPTSYLTTAASTDTEDEEIVKRSKLERLSAPSSSFSSSSSSSLHSSSSRIKESYESRRRRFRRTAEALRHSGLLNVTTKTAELLRKNQDLQKEIENLQRETRSFVLSVLTNPENRPVLNNIGSQSQLYEIVVPGSQGIMSVTSSASLPEHNLCYRNSMSSGDSDSLDSNDGVSSPSPAPSESSDGFSSMSEDSDSSEKENLTPLPSVTSSSIKR